jgi:transcriptional regulator with XRE-family HTH domain
VVSNEPETAGLVALRETGLKQAQIAKDLGIGADVVSRWFATDEKEKRKPSLSNAVKLQELYGIDVSLWTRAAPSDPEEAA